MELSHTQARTWLQRQLDHSLAPEEHTLLAAHLRACPECANYGREISEAEAGLRSMLKRRWSHPVPHVNRAAIHAGSRNNWRLAFTGRLVVVLSLLAGIFSVWQFSTPTRSGAPLLLSIAPVPTPSLTFTATQADTGSCAPTPYTVATGDTLAGIAKRFALPPALLQQMNHLPSDNVFTGDILLIPACTLTPTSTLHPATVTPTRQTFTTTPG